MACLHPIAEELGADEVRIVPLGDDPSAIPGQLLIRDGLADDEAASALRDRGFPSRLALPIAAGGRTVGSAE